MIHATKIRKHVINMTDSSLTEYTGALQRSITKCKTDPRYIGRLPSFLDAVQNMELSLILAEQEQKRRKPMIKTNPSNVLSTTPNSYLEDLLTSAEAAKDCLHKCKLLGLVSLPFPNEIFVQLNAIASQINAELQFRVAQAAAKNTALNSSTNIKIFTHSDKNVANYIKEHYPKSKDEITVEEIADALMKQGFRSKRGSKIYTHDISEAAKALGLSPRVPGRVVRPRAPGKDNKINQILKAIMKSGLPTTEKEALLRGLL